MRELAERVEAASEHVDPAWGEAEIEAGVQALRRAQRERARRRRAVIGGALAVSTATAIAAAVALAIMSGGPTRAPEPMVAHDDAPLLPAPLRLADGSRVQPADAETRVVVAEVAPERVRVELARGGASFDVTPDPERRFEIDVGDVHVSVLGTSFVLQRDDEAHRVRVDVSRGRVAVRWPDGSTELGAGESGWFPPAGETAREETAEEPARETARREPARHRARTEWRALAQDGQFERAYDALEASGESGVRDDVAELLLAADAARYSGHAGQATRWLRRAIDRDPHDPRAPLAAFTLGRVLLGQLGRPREAARAFAEAQRLDPSGSMAEDALAREVECWSRAEEPALAAERARAYLARYPEGRRAVAVRRYGGIE